MTIAFLIGFVILLFPLLLGIPAIFRSIRNPLPKFDNWDKRFSEVKMVKTRVIETTILQ